MPQPPSTLEGAYLLHQLYRVDWTLWHSLKEKKRKRIQKASAAQLQALIGEGEDSGAYYHVLGHKGDLMFLFSRASGEKLAEVERELTTLPIWPFLEPTWSYFSVVELSLHGAHERYRNLLIQQGLQENTPEWDQALETMLEEDRQVQRARLYPQIPEQDYICFYPMDKRRGEVHNWFTLEAPDRGKLMSAHGKTGRKYTGKVTQLISSSMGLDDYDWGVDLFSQDTLNFKKLLYEMRFDAVSALYADFGTFVIGRRLDPKRLLDLRPWPSAEPTPEADPAEA
ncbi:heme-dependent peroxidase [bacterium]|nr:heme-dependent peroxidase [bacterium]